MPGFIENHFTLDLKKSADLGPSKTVFTLVCGKYVFGALKDSKNFLLTPGKGLGRENYPQWESLKKLLISENVLIFSYQILRKFLGSEEFEKFVTKKRTTTIEIIKICELLLPQEEFTSPEHLNNRLNDLFRQKHEDESVTSKLLLGKLAWQASGFDRNVRLSVAQILLPVYPLIADWIKNFREHERELPKAYCDSYPEHVIDFQGDEENEIQEENSLEDIFSPEGRLSHVCEDYEYRREQADFAHLYSRALKNSEIFLAEAGTGTGKSLAYLIPLILKCTGRTNRSVVATYSKTLQSQLFFSDLKTALKTCNKKILVSMLKGAGNYLCLLKKAMFKTRARSGLTPEEFFDLARLEIWATLTHSGDLAEINLQSRKVVAEIAVENNFCLKQACQFYKQCYLFKARKLAARSHIIVVNQALFFTDLILNSGLISGRNIAVFDEAHRLEKTATSYLGGELENRHPLSVLNGIYGLKDEGGTLLSLLKRSISSYAHSTEDYQEDFNSIKELVLSAQDYHRKLFKQIKTYQTKKRIFPETFAAKKRFDKKSDIYKHISVSLEDMISIYTGLIANLTVLYNEMSSYDLQAEDHILAEEINRSLGELNGIKLNL